jgi:diadenosine tetraphosphate (Ap4A) HIT family hydrolase
MTCELCATLGGQLLWEGDRCRVVLINEPGYTGYCRVIWNTHVAEMTDLAEADRAHCLRVVLTVEAVLRELLSPHKVNLASLGNFTPHVHWHVIPRFLDDPHFPQAIWGLRQRESVMPTKAPVDLPERIARQLASRLNV